MSTGRVRTPTHLGFSLVCTTGFIIYPILAFIASKQDFVKALQPIAKDVGTKLGIDPKIVMAQAILETGYGSKVKGGNYFGIKSHGKAGG